MKRKIVHIDEKKCNGCGLCVSNCAEGALKIINGKAKLVSDVYCDGLGACLGHCPQGAITIIERLAEEFDEKKVIKHVNKEEHMGHSECCPGSKMQDFRNAKTTGEETNSCQSQLRQWPVQLHLISPEAPYCQKADVLLSADCVAYALGDFHQNYLNGKAIAIACPKLDSDQDVYLEKITSLIDEAKINTLTVMTMQVPCCNGLLSLAQEALKSAKRKIPVKSIVVSLQGNIISEEWV